MYGEYWHFTVAKHSTIQEEDFFDAVEYTDYNENISVGTGNSTYTESNDATKCVKDTNTVIYVAVPGEGTLPIGGGIQCPVGECLLGGTHVLKPKESVSEADHKEGNILKFFHLVWRP